MTTVKWRITRKLNDLGSYIEVDICRRGKKKFPERIILWLIVTEVDPFTKEVAH